MRRILFVTQTANVRGGLETWLDEIVPFLAGRGWSPTIGLARGRRFHDPAAYRRAHPTFTTIEIDGTAGTREARVGALRKVLREVAPDVVVPVNVSDLYEAVAREKLGGSMVRIVAMLRAQFPHGDVEDIRRWRDFIDLVVGGNRLLRMLTAEWAGVEDERLRWIPPGSRRKGSNTRVPKPAGLVRLAYVGRLDDQAKRVLDLVGVVRELGRLGTAFELDVAGDGPDRAALESALASEAASGRIRILGERPVGELYDELFPRVDVLLHFSAAEAGPQVIWQAMHFGVVPVSSRYLGATAEGVLLDGETALLFPVGDVLGAAAHVARVACDPSLMDAISRAAERAVDPSYLLDHSFERWLEAFEDALTMQPAVGLRLPDVARTPSGFLERIHVPTRLAFVARRTLGRLPDAREPGAEWPHHGPIDGETYRRIDILVRSLDRERADCEGL